MQQAEEDIADAAERIFDEYAKPQTQNPLPTICKDLWTFLERQICALAHADPYRAAVSSIARYLV